MSFLEDSPSEHNKVLSLSINIALKSLKNAKLVQADGGLVFSDQVVPPSKSILSYRPDALIETSVFTWILEVKTYEDLFSSHSSEQFRKMNSICEGLPSWRILLTIFKAPKPPASVPLTLRELYNMRKCSVLWIDHDWRIYEPSL